MCLIYLQIQLVQYLYTTATRSPRFAHASLLLARFAATLPQTPPSPPRAVLRFDPSPSQLSLLLLGLRPLRRLALARRRLALGGHRRTLAQRPPPLLRSSPSATCAPTRRKPLADLSISFSRSRWRGRSVCSAFRITAISSTVEGVASENQPPPPPPSYAARVLEEPLLNLLRETRLLGRRPCIVAAVPCDGAAALGGGRRQQRQR